MKHYLMIKTHRKTRLKYLCKKSTNNRESCFTYLGSGKYWKYHIRKHGPDIETSIIEECGTKEELIQKGIEWSKKLNVIESNEFANLVIERGDGGPTMLGRKMTPTQNRNKGEAHKRFWRTATEEWKERKRLINSKSHERYMYFTPYGIFTNAYVAARAANCSNVTIINRCIRDFNKKINARRYYRYGWCGKTWRELGWYSKSLHTQCEVPDLQVKPV